MNTLSGANSNADSSGPLVSPPLRENRLGTRLLIPWIIIGIVALSTGMAYLARKSAQTPQRAREAAPVQPRLAAPGGNPPTRLTRRESTPAPREVHSWEASVSQASPAVVPARTSAPSTGSQPAVGAGSATVAQQLLARLSQVDVSRKALTREQAAELNRLLRQLLEQGDVAIPGIREFLKSNQDINFDALDGGEFVDFGSLRLGLLDALQRMGTTEAVQLSLETLVATADPLELALLARMLERIAPAQYRQQELTAARETLALAASGTWDGRDISALFELLQKYGDSSVVADLEGAVTRFPHAAGHVERQAGQLRIHARELQRGSAPPPLRRLHRRHGGDVPPLVPSAACHHVRGQRREAHHQAR